MIGIDTEPIETSAATTRARAGPDAAFRPMLPQFRVLCVAPASYYVREE